MPNRSIPRPTLVLGLVVAVVAWLFLVTTGVGVWSAAVLVAIVAVQTGAGGWLWSLLRTGRSGPVENVGMGMALGTVLAVLSGLLVQVLTGWRFGWGAPVLVALVVWLTRRGWRSVGSSEGLSDRATILGAAVAIVLGGFSLVPNVLSYPLTWVGMWSRYHPDMLFFESLSTSLAQLGPLDSIYTPDALIRYHWLVYAWAGQVGNAAGAPPFVVLTRVLPFVAVIGTGLVAVAWARRLSSAVWAPALAVVLLVAGGYVGATYGAVFNFDSPSQSMTMLWLLGLSVTAVTVLGEGARSWGAWRTALGAVSLMAFAFSLAGGKISAGAVGLAAALWLAFVGVVRRTAWRGRGLVVAAAVSVGFLLGYVLVVAGSADPGGLKLANLLDRASSVQGLNPVPGSIGIVAGTLLLAVAIAVRWAGLGWLLVDRKLRWAPDTVLGFGYALAAVGTVLLISGGLNDTWFALAASAPLAVLSAAGAGEASLALGRRRGLALAALCVAAVLLFVGVAGLWMTGASGGNVFVSTLRWLGPLVGFLGAVLVGALIGWRFGGSGRPMLAGAVILLVLLAAPGRGLGVGTGLVGVQPGLSADAFSTGHPFTSARDRTMVVSWSDQHAAAASWLRAHASQDDLVATNVTFSPFVPALTGLRTYVSGILYQAPYGRPGGIPTLLEREAQSWAFVDTPNAATLAPLCRAGVDWVWVDPTRTSVVNWAPFAEASFRNDSVVLLRLATC